MAKSYFKQICCHGRHTRFVVFFPLPSCCVSSLLSFALTLTRPTNYFRQNIVFSYWEMSFFFLIISLFFVCFFFFRYFMLFCYYCIAFIFSCSGMFRNGPCSGMFHVPDFIDARKELFSASSVHLLLFIAKREEKLQR